MSGGSPREEGVDDDSRSASMELQAMMATTISIECGEWSSIRRRSRDEDLIAEGFKLTMWSTTDGEDVDSGNTSSGIVTAIGISRLLQGVLRYWILMENGGTSASC